MRRILLATSIALVFVFFAVLIIGNITEAQRPDSSDRRRQRPRGERARPTGLGNFMGGISNSFWQVAIMMDTTDEQLVKIRTGYKEILKEAMAKRKELQEKANELRGSENREQRRELFQQSRELFLGINKNLKVKLKVTLTEKQFAEYEKWEKARQESARRRSQDRGERPRRRDTQPTKPEQEKEGGK